MVWGFFKLITPFIDPRTVDKLKFNEVMTQYVEPDQLWTEYQEQGRLDFEYDHAEYWPALEKLCAEIRAERKARWVAGGKLVGEFEDYITGATDEGAAKAEGVNGEVKPEDLKVGELSVEDEKEGANGDKKEGEEAKASA